MLTDLRLAFRQVRHQPAFTAVAVLTLALAVAANTSILSLLNGGLLRPAVPVRPDEYVCVYTARQDAARDFRPFRHDEFAALRAANPVFQDVAAIGFAEVALGQAEEIRRAFVFLASENFFRLGGVAPAAGRFFNEEETKPGAGRRVAVVSHTWWERHGQSPAVLGSALVVNGHSYTIVGVAPRGFSGVSPMLGPEVWLPLGVTADVGVAFARASGPAAPADPAAFPLNLFARLQPELTPDLARGLLPALAARIDALNPGDRAKRELVLGRPFGIAPTPQSRSPLALLGLLTLAMAGLVLAIAGLNLANMFLARGAARTAEFAVRLALGGSRVQVVRQLLAEALVIALLGGVLGSLVGTWGVALLEGTFTQRLGSFGFIVTAELKPDWHVLVATLAGCTVVTALFSLGPALQSTRVDLVSDLKSRGSSAGGWDRFWSGPNLLVTAQIAVALALLFVAGLFLRAAWQAGRPPPGLAIDAAVVGELDFSLSRAPRPAVEARLREIAERLETLPGARAAGFTTLLPFANVEADGHLALATPAHGAVPDHPPAAVLAGITPGYLAAVGAQLVRGREFTAGEARDPAANRVCLVDEGMATRLFGAGDAIGQRVRLQAGDAGGEYEVVGVVRAHPQDAADIERPLRRVFVPFARAYSPHVFFAVAAAPGLPADATALGTIRRELLAIDPVLPLVDLRPFRAHLTDNFTLWQTRLGGTVFGLLGGLALVLATIGAYGVKAYAVTRRTREIGIRMALGADRSQVVGLVLRQTLLQLAVALAAGAVLSFACGRLLRGFLVNVDPADPFAFGCAALCLAAASLAATFGPARKATRVDPLVALRAE